MTVLVTGAAGFIGYHVSAKLMRMGERVVGIDSLTDFYNPALKLARLEQLKGPLFTFHKQDLRDPGSVNELVSSTEPETVVHLAAQPGVRQSIVEPHLCVESNVMAFLNVLEACRRSPPAHLVYASSSSVYGANSDIPFSVKDGVNHPVSLYAATKRANELMAHTYSHLYGIPTTGLRFFTVYGPWGRPDMAYFKFTSLIDQGLPIEIFGDGSCVRDLTFVDDIVESLVRVAAKPTSSDASLAGASDPSRSVDPFRLFNVGYGSQISINGMIELIELNLGRKAKRIYLDAQAGDVPRTHADVEDLDDYISYRPVVSVEVGIARFIDWYLSYCPRT